MKTRLYQHIRSGLFSIMTMVSLFAFQKTYGQITETFTSNSTFTVPAGVTSITVECWGAGGGGATMTTFAGGGGGGGGAYASSVLAVSPGNIFDIVVGIGGGPGVNGGNSTFDGTAVVAVGGSGVATNVNAGGSGGLGSTGTTTFVGGNGGTGQTSQGRNGGGGGGGAGSTGDGGNGSTSSGGTGTALNGGDGGDGGGNNGLIYGGGGGGSKRTGTGGSGAAGLVTVSYTVSAFNCPESTAVSPAGAQTICQGDISNQLTAAITNSGGSGTPTLLYQWYYNTTNSNTVSGATLLSGATSSTYTPLSTASELGDRWYFCVGYASDNGCSQTSTDQTLASNAVQVTVSGTPTTAAAGSPQTICNNGSNATLGANTPISGTGAWSVQSGPSTSSAQFANTADPGTIFTPAGGTGSYLLRWTISNSPCTPSTSDVTITVITIPSTPAAISGPEIANPNTSGLVYSISAVPNATTYNWAVPTGWSITAGAGTTSITVSSGNANQNGNITVTAQNSCGTSTASTLAVISDNIDCPISTSVAPSAIQTICQGIPSNQLTASATTSGGSGLPTIQYQWYYNTSNSNTISGATLLSGATSQTYIPQTSVSELGSRWYFSVAYASDNGCSQTNDTQSLASIAVEITVDPIPATPGTISGSTNAMPNTSGLVYSISAVPNATNYNWTVPTGWVIDSGDGTVSISVTSGNIGQNGSITVTAQNSCGTSAASTLAVIASTTGNPPTISLGSIPTICSGISSVNLPYSATTESPDQYSINFDLTAETAGFVDVINNSLPATPISISVPGALTTGNYNGLLQVRNSSTGLSSVNYAIQISIIDIPSTPIISGQINVPENSVGFNYWVANVPSATTYSWSVPSGWIITSGNNTNGITVSTGALGQDGTITVTVTNACGTSPQGSLAVSVSSATDHTLYNCTSCHITHNAPGSNLTNVGGNALLCQSCHSSTGAASAKAIVNGDNGVSSHAWDVLAVNATKETNLPLDSQMVLRIVDSKIICSTCHDQHNTSVATPHLRLDNTGDALCKDCHSARDVGLFSTDNTNHKGSHPVGITYDSGDSRFNTSPTNTQLVSGKVECSSCHGVHDVDGSLGLATNGNLLRTTNDVNLCTDCHNYGTHNNMDCLDCHQVHNTDKANIYMIRNSIVTPNSGTKTVAFTTQTGLNSFADGDTTYDGICEVCHTSTSHYNNDGTATDQNHSSQGGQDGANCTTCHPHGSGFAPVGCIECHQTAFPNWGITDAHFEHSSRYSFNCNTCHLNYGSGGSLEPIHPDSTLDTDNTMITPVAAEVNIDPNGMATRNGQDGNSPVFNGDKTCGNIYCHSSGNTADRGGDAEFSSWGNLPFATMVYITTPAWDTGSLTACNSCHGAAGNMNDPYTITNDVSGPVTGSGDVPPSGSHSRGAHISNSQNLSGNGWSNVQCFWCHNTTTGSDASPNNQGTYNTSWHVDGETYFKPKWWSNGGTMVNTMTYSSEGSAAHCGVGKRCW